MQKRERIRPIRWYPRVEENQESFQFYQHIRHSYLGKIQFPVYSVNSAVFRPLSGAARATAARGLLRAPRQRPPRLSQGSEMRSLFRRRAKTVPH